MEKELEFECSITLKAKIKVSCEYINGQPILDDVEDIIADAVDYDLKNTEEDYDVRFVEVTGYEEVEPDYENDERVDWFRMAKFRTEDVQLIEDFLDLLNRREEEHCHLFDERNNLTREQNDLLHELENNPCTKINITEELARVRKEYRQTKNDMEFYFPIKQFSKK